MPLPDAPPPPPRVARIELVGYKAFKRTTVALRESAYVVGPNSAGKSTLIEALRGAARMLDHAMKWSPDTAQRDRGRQVPAHSFTAQQVAIHPENLRHEFAEEKETRIEIHFSTGAALRAVWPPCEERASPDAGFFYVEADGHVLRQPKHVRTAFPTLGIVPTLAPLERNEHLLNFDYLKRNTDGSRCSRHFRNQLYLLAQQRDMRGGTGFDDFVAFAAPWNPEIELRAVKARFGGKQSEIDVFIREADSRTERELCWAGDGFQIWLQVLFHMYRLRGCPVVVLDEPDVFLHADLQRRLVRLLRDHEGQTVIATHSSEILGEAGVHSIVWIDKYRRYSTLAPQGDDADRLSAALGSQFNLRLARALRAKVALFVEGTDMSVLHRLAEKIGAERVAREREIAVVPLHGFSNWGLVEPFAWFVQKLLGGSVAAYVILDRDFRSETACAGILENLRKAGIHGHIWRRKELESYLLEARPVARAAGAPLAEVDRWLREVAADLKAMVFSRCLGAEVTRRRAVGVSVESCTESFLPEFEALWAGEDGGAFMCSAADVLAGLNQKLADSGHRTVSFGRLSRRIEASEVPPEMGAALLEIDRLVG